MEMAFHFFLKVNNNTDDDIGNLGQRPHHQHIVIDVA